jgi:DNA-binding NarL/FixJ family response regulator
MKPIRIVLADDHPLVLAGIRMVLESASGLKVVGEATNGTQAFDLVVATLPDIAILDVSLPGINGIALAERLHESYPNIGVVMLTAHEERNYIDLALSAGARGYILKKSPAECLVQGIRGVHVGGLYIDPALAAKMFGGSGQREFALASGHELLTDREAEVVKSVASGLTNRAIAEKLRLSEKSVETYRARASKKIRANTRADLVRYASARGWLDPV